MTILGASEDQTILRCGDEDSGDVQQLDISQLGKKPKLYGQEPIRYVGINPHYERMTFKVWISRTHGMKTLVAHRDSAIKYLKEKLDIKG